MPFSSPHGDISVPDVALHQFLLRKTNEIIRHSPDKKVFIMASNPDDFLTYRQLGAFSEAIAKFLHNHGFVKETACTVIPNCHQFPTFFLGVASQGGALSGASPLFTTHEIHRQFADSQCTTVLTDGPNVGKVLEAMEGLPHVKLVIVVGVSSSALSSLPSRGVGLFSWEEVISTPVDSSRPSVPIDIVNDVALLPYSSGTTGPPKGVMITHRNFVASASAYCKMRDVGYEMEPDSKMDWSREYMLLFLPFYHIYGYCMICTTLIEGSTTVILGGFDPNLFLSCMETYKIRELNVAPPILLFLVKSPLCAKFDLTSLKKVTSGAAPAGKDLCDEFLKKYPHVERFAQGYGMTETTDGSHYSDAQSRAKFGCVGKIAPGMRMKIIDTETGEELASGRAGEIVVHGENIMKGYLKRDQATAETIREGWLHTGRRPLFIVDRLKELIKVKGLQVPPAELEDLLLSHPRIADAAVIGVPNLAAGELPKLTAQEVYDFVKERVSKYKNLNGGIEFIDAIPKSPSGKILRKELRARDDKAKI